MVGREAEMVRNAAGGYVFPVTDWTRLERFLILGTDAGTYYTGARALTLDNAEGRLAEIRPLHIAADGPRRSSGSEISSWTSATLHMRRPAYR